MAVAVLDHEVEVLLQLLSNLSTNQLAIAVTQHANLSSILVNALHDLAAASITESSVSSRSSSTQQQGTIIADLARKLITRGDPSLVNKILPRSSLIDLALCTDARDVLARLIDDTGAYDCIRAASTVFESTAKDTSGEKIESISRIGRAAQVLSRVVSAMPMRRIAEEKLTKGQREQGSKEYSLLCKTTRDLRLAYEGLQGVGTLPALKAKVSLLDAAWFISERLSLGAVKSSSRSPSQELDDFLTALCGGSDLHTGILPLSNMPFAVDLALVRPLVDGIRRVEKSYTSNILDILEGRARRFRETTQGGSSVETLGSAWMQVISFVQTHQEEVGVPANLVETILAVLPDLGNDRAGLERRLRGPQYAGMSAEIIIQALFDEEDGAMVQPDGSEVDEDIEALRLLRERANVFNEQPLQGVTVTRGKGRERGADHFDLSSGLSEEIRAAILARAELPDSDEEEEWNPFNNAVVEVGFEEEMEEEQENATKTAIGRGAGAIHDDDDEEEDDDENEEGEADGAKGAAGHGGGSIESSKVAAERAAERILISAWSERGEDFFSKEARKASARSELKMKLNDLPGKKWDDALIESWATMFSRNPRKEKLLAAVDDIMLLGNQNLAQSKSSGFGVNRGREGRIMREPVEGGRGGRGRGRGRGSSRGGKGGAKRGRGAA